MKTIWTDVDPAITATALAMAMCICWSAAWWRGRTLRLRGQGISAAKLTDAILALLGLLLAFTFSMSLMKHEQRRQMSVVDSNAIGDFHTCAMMLDDPVRAELHAVIREYVQHRLAVSQAPDASALQVKLQEIRSMHDRMQSLVKAAVDGRAPVVVPLVMTFNAVTSSHAARLAAVRDRLPASVLLMLLFAAVLSITLIGWQQGATGEMRPGATMGFAILICLVVWVTLDLNQPQRGWITVSQEPLRELLRGMQE
ncbi:MAG: hypothetical protein KF861_10095 [Planctomycetaceae bacterium]|nr:hypothetical protein [Planctomycetaceae bacterium]